MIIAVAGPYSAPTPEARARNLDVLNTAAAELLAMGHTPVVGVNAALPVVERTTQDIDRYHAIMEISMAVISCCEAVLLLAESPGANRECEYFLSRGLPVYHSLASVPHVLQTSTSR
jgi:hypothetical protein